MAAERIGRAHCPICGSTRARLSLSRSGLVCMTCDGCNLQVFARSSTSDELLRRHRLPDADQAPAPAQPAPAPKPSPAPATAPAARPAWGFLGATS